MPLIPTNVLISTLQGFLVTPSLLILIGGILLTLIAAWRYSAFHLISALALAFTGVAFIFSLMAIFMPLGETLLPYALFQGKVLITKVGLLWSSLILLGSLIVQIFSWFPYLEEENSKPEYRILLLFGTLGALVMVMANNLLVLYLGLELQALTLCILAAFSCRRISTPEAALKYCLLSAIASAIFLYGVTWIYGVTGSMNFAEIANEVMTHESIPLAFWIGFFMVIAGLAFKISAVPFHMWTPDVYEGVSTPIASFFASVSKIAAMAVILRLVSFLSGITSSPYPWFVGSMAAASMIFGALGALMQTHLRRFFAYSSIAHMGYALIGVSVLTVNGLKGTTFYMIMYFIMTVGIFATLMMLRHKEGGAEIDRIDHLAGLIKTQPHLALCLSFLLFSLAGLPPLAGFFAKFYVLSAALDGGLYTLAFIGAILTVVSAYYYLRMIKVMWLDTPVCTYAPLPRPFVYLSWGSVACLLAFFFLPEPFLKLLS
jgi:NADH-quinone oxidoreductase subunit N